MRFTAMNEKYHLVGILLLLCCSILCSSILCSCSPFEQDKEQVVIKQSTTGKEVPLEVYVDTQVPLGKYEPATGLYMGAYVAQDNLINGDILEYETLIGQKQTFKVFNYKAEDGITKQDILKCIAQKKIPYIKLLLNTDYDLTDLYQMIFDINAAYKTPVFIELFPLTERDYNVASYKETYQRAYEIIHKYVVDAVIVWSVDETRVQDFAVFYPGNGYIDWAGLNIYVPRFKKNEPYEYKGLKQLDFWYKSFQDKKPMLISGLAVSHYSKVDHAYTVGEAVSTLQLFYEEALLNYPRLKGIIYMDIDMAALSERGKEDYRLTGHKQLIEAMHNLSYSLRINPGLVKEADKLTYPMKYSISGVYFDEVLYIPQEYMALCFRGVPLRKLTHLEDLNGEIYYAFKDIQTYCNCYYKA